MIISESDLHCISILSLLKVHVHNYIKADIKLEKKVQDNIPVNFQN